MGENLAERDLKLSLPKKKSAPLSVPIEKRVHPYLFRFRKIMQAYLFRSTKECRPICSALKNYAGQPGPTYIADNIGLLVFKNLYPLIEPTMINSNVQNQKVPA